MYAKSFIALDGNGRLTGARTAQRYPHDRYTYLLCGSTLRYHPEYNTEQPFFEHRSDILTDNGRQHCPYVNLEAKGTRHIRQLQWYVPEARPLVYRSDWHCNGCDGNYHGERYCLSCRTGEYSHERTDVTGSTPEVTVCAC